MLQKTPQKDIDELHRAIGSAISSWTVVELYLNQIFCVATSLTVAHPGGSFSLSSGTPIAVLDAIDGFRGKLLMIDAALRAALVGLDEEATTILNEWATAREKLPGWHSKRNKLAHWRVECIVKRDGTQKVKLSAPSYSLKKGSAWVTDVQAWEEAFYKLGYELAAVAFKLAAHKGLQRKFVEQAASQIRCSLPHDPTLLEILERELFASQRP